MHYIVTADTDKGRVKQTNQDSVVFKHAEYDHGEIVMAIICDGMGGLSKGELASASVVKAFVRWFENDLPYELENPDMNVIGANWSLMLKELNVKILEYSKAHGVDSIGTTFTGILFIDNKYVIAHVGDTRVYHLDRSLRQLTTDQTFIAREISRGTLTVEQAKTDKRRNLLLQCIGASKNVEPEVITGDVENGVYMLCSDGFRHEISEKEIFDNLKPAKLKNQKTMHANAKNLIEEVKNRGEVDNISVLLIKVEGGGRR
ncbi:MAG: PP2C family protein-serine/threonine phosphatase [Bulleidia sp.]